MIDIGPVVVFGRRHSPLRVPRQAAPTVEVVGK